MTTSAFFPAEWAPQDAILLAWPHKGTDWAPMLDETIECFINIIETVSRYQNVVVLVNDEKEKFDPGSFTYPDRIVKLICPTNDTWARDFGPLFIKKGDNYVCPDFKFNGWGLKFAADRDNRIKNHLFDINLFSSKVSHNNQQNFVLEGGSIETDGNGTLLTTSACLLSPNRNGQYNKQQIEEKLKMILGVQRILWLNHGFLTGDDTDSHIDTLARFCNPDTISYIKCNDPDDSDYEELQQMEQELHSFRTPEGEPYNLIPLPMAEPVFEKDGHRLPATYANFLIINNAVLMPFYNSPKDYEAREIIQSIFPLREVIGIDCRALIKQHGSLHCVTMQLPRGILRAHY